MGETLPGVKKGASPRPASTPAVALATGIGAGMAIHQHSPGGIVAHITTRNTKDIRNKSYNREIRILSTRNHS
jgi:hypothetical protein